MIIPSRTMITTILRRAWAQVVLEFIALTREVFVNSILGAAPMPRLGRIAGYRLAGIRIHTVNVFSGLKVYGPSRNLSIGRGTFINHDCYIETVGAVTVGDQCQFGPQVCILTSHHPWTGHGHVASKTTPRAVHIGNRVWIGARAVIVPGTTIGDDVAIGAGAVVTGNCLRAGTYLGVPARWVAPPPGSSAHHAAENAGVAP